MIALDTNVLVRYIAQDDLRQTAAAKHCVETTCTPEAPGFVCLLVLAELVWVCTSCYSASRKEVVRILSIILSAKQLQVQEADVAWQALGLFEHSKADFSDCVVARLAANAGCSKTVTFDKRAALMGMTLLDF